MPPPAADFIEVFRVFARAEVDYVVIGGIAAVLHGAPLVTLDLDVVHDRTEPNVTRLASALAQLDARYRLPGQQDRRPQAVDLAGSGHHLLLTRAGPLDLLGRVATGDAYTELLAQSEAVTLEPGIRVQIVNLETVIRIKERLGREKDRAALAVLKRTLEERGKG